MRMRKNVNDQKQQIQQKHPKDRDGGLGTSKNRLQQWTGRAANYVDHKSSSVPFDMALTQR